MATIQVTRTNYDRFETECGDVWTGAMLRDVRYAGYGVWVTDATPADDGEWFLEPLN